ncbi:MAG TPA: DNA translocase FtsK [Candidatus Paceibacterota bacterium]|nr:DNA translocase FtsK [Candidatus Paceibacterota bacterium]
MAKNNSKNGRNANNKEHRLHPETKNSIWGMVIAGLSIIFFLAGFHKAGPGGEFLYGIFKTLLGLGYLAFPAILMVVAGVFLVSQQKRFMSITLLGALLFILSVLGLIDIAEAGGGGWLGLILGSLKIPFGSLAASVIDSIAMAAAILVTLNVPLKIKFPEKKEREVPLNEEEENKIAAVEKEQKEISKSPEPEEVKVAEHKTPIFAKIKKSSIGSFPAQGWSAFGGKNYVPPTLDLLKSSVEKPTTGDLRANANVIKRTLDSFGIPVEMGEINIGPKVTRYTLKPAEGVKLARITALGQDLAMALAAHPIRIEAPIPGKSLVGIEVPNKAAALVRLGSLMAYSEFNASGLLGFTLGRDVTGEPIFANLEKMPHLLIAGSTGSGKSIMIQSLIISLLYKNSPATMKMIMIDPKRVELSGYEGIPHLVSPVIVENKKALNVFRWAVKEMEQRYELLQKSGNRDIKSYNEKIKGAPSDKEDAPQPLPYIVIIVDELADLMSSYGREVEGYVVRLAQMARATGIHLVLSTQRPSVEIITGLIKANITSRIALQVASQIDSRTIIDASGAEKLLGAGDLLFISSDLSKPKRIQGAYISEDEIKKVADFIRDNNEMSGDEIQFSADNASGNGNGNENMFHLFDDSLEENGDEMYDEAVEVVRQAQKASASLLQRRLKVGYARAARLLDLMEEKGIIGPGEGAKPRDVYLGKDVFPE